MGGSGYFQDTFLKAVSTEFADELNVLYQTKRRVQDMDYLFYSMPYLNHLDSVCYSIYIP